MANAVTFTRKTSTYDPATGITTLAQSTITGDAIQVRGQPQRYQALKLDLATMPTLLFTPTTYPLKAGTSEFVLPGDSVVWNGDTYKVEDVDAVAPDGTAVIARVVVSR